MALRRAAGEKAVTIYLFSGGAQKAAVPKLYVTVFTSLTAWLCRLLTGEWIGEPQS